MSSGPEQSEAEEIACENADAILHRAVVVDARYSTAASAVPVNCPSSADIFEVAAELSCSRDPTMIDISDGRKFRGNLTQFSDHFALGLRRYGVYQCPTSRVGADELDEVATVCTVELDDHLSEAASLGVQEILPLNEVPDIEYTVADHILTLTRFGPSLKGSARGRAGRRQTSVRYVSQRSIHPSDLEEFLERGAVKQSGGARVGPVVVTVGTSAEECAVVHVAQAHLEVRKVVVKCRVAAGVPLVQCERPTAAAAGESQIGSETFGTQPRFDPGAAAWFVTVGSPTR